MTVSSSACSGQSALVAPLLDVEWPEKTCGSFFRKSDWSFSYEDSCFLFLTTVRKGSLKTDLSRPQHPQRVHFSLLRDSPPQLTGSAVLIRTQSSPLASAEDWTGFGGTISGSPVPRLALLAPLSLSRLTGLRATYS